MGEWRGVHCTSHKWTRPKRDEIYILSVNNKNTRNDTHTQKKKSRCGTRWLCWLSSHVSACLKANRDVMTTREVAGTLESRKKIWIIVFLFADVLIFIICWWQRKKQPFFIRASLVVVCVDIFFFHHRSTARENLDRENVLIVYAFFFFSLVHISFGLFWFNQENVRLSKKQFIDLIEWSTKVTLENATHLCVCAFFVLVSPLD